MSQADVKGDIFLLFLLLLILLFLLHLFVVISGGCSFLLGLDRLIFLGLSVVADFDRD